MVAGTSGVNLWMGMALALVLADGRVDMDQGKWDQRG